MLYVFIGCLAFGALYSVGSIVLGGHGFDHGGVDHVGVDGHSGSDSADTPSPFNPVVIASAISTFGAVGLIGKLGFGMGDFLSSVLSLAFAGVVGTLIFFGVVKLMYSSQSNSAFSESDLAGVEGEVITPISENGIGEVAYTANGIRYTMAARSFYGEAIQKGEKIRIKDVAAHTAVVTRLLTLDSFELSTEEEKQSLKDNKNKNI